MQNFYEFTNRDHADQANLYDFLYKNFETQGNRGIFLTFVGSKMFLKLCFDFLIFTIKGKQLNSNDDFYTGKVF